MRLRIWDRWTALAPAVRRIEGLQRLEAAKEPALAEAMRKAEWVCGGR